MHIHTGQSARKIRRGIGRFVDSISALPRPWTTPRLFLETILPERQQKPDTLLIRPMRPDEDLAALVDLYDSAWYERASLERVFGQKEVSNAARLCIREAELLAQYRSFPAGQFIGITRGGQSTGPVLASMLNTFVFAADTVADIPAGYDTVTSSRTFAHHSDPAICQDKTGVLICVSIAVPPVFRGRDYAQQTLKAGMEFAQKNGLLIVPYSAPRGFGAYLKRHPHTKIQDYLHITRKRRKISATGKAERRALERQAYRDYCKKIERFNKTDNARGLNQKLSPLSLYMFRHEAYYVDAGGNAYDSFRERHATWFFETYGRQMTIADYMRLSGRDHMDPVMNMHIQLGADFIYKGDGSIACVFEGSRPEDISAAGYNILLTYSYNPEFFRVNG